MEDIVIPIVACGTLFVGLPWIILHHVTKWKTAATLTQGDEALLEELYQVARRLDERMDTVERLVAADHPEFHPGLPLPNSEHDNLPLNEIDRLRGQRQGVIR
ncbi:MAG: envelope stress response membrane protein PspB [Proteobacteria bacterium]|nr:envelope stress response membrane protein PspB [Pseudomonadota bacterium]